MNKNELIIDWFQVTIFPFEREESNLVFDDKFTFDLFFDLFGLVPGKIIREPFGYHGYNTRYSYNDISIMYNSNRPEMGFNILMSGQGCRDFEELNISWFELFNKLSDYNFNFNRIDIAIDTFTSKYFDIEKLIHYVRKDACVSKFKSTLQLIKNLTDGGSVNSNTVQFGSKASDIQITFYDKYKERVNAGFIVENDIKFWVRTELRFRHERAMELYHYIQDGKLDSKFIKSILYNYIDFKTISSSDSNRSRRPSTKWWTSFLEDTEKLRLATRTTETSISRKYNWLLESVSKTEVLCYFSKLPNLKLDSLSNDLLYTLLTNGSKKITDKDIQLVNDFRISKKLVPISKQEILEYLDDLKTSVLFEK